MVMKQVDSSNCRCVNRDTVVSIGTCYGLDVPVIESPWGEIFRTGPGAHPIGAGSLSRGKAAEVWS
jgi:hypothetical protein